MDLDEFFSLDESKAETSLVRSLSDLRSVDLDEELKVWVGRLPLELCSPDLFEPLWELHPEEFPVIQMYEKKTPIPRWQQAYGRDYRFSGQISAALPVPDSLRPYLDWTHSLDEKLTPINGLLLNWYDDEQKHYIGKHRDSTTGLVPGLPIVTLSLGGTRAFRLRPFRVPGAPYTDIEVENGSVVVIPWKTNKAWTHEVPTLASRYSGRRISITLRAFE
jgi:alkylated DNA repair dioxygenase AlkB